MAQGLDLLAGKAGEAISGAYKEKMNQTYFKLGLLRQQQERQFQEKLAHQKQIFEAGEQQKKLDAQKSVAEYREEQATSREQMGIEAGKYDKTGRWSFWNKLKLDPKYKAALSVASSNIGELSDILSSPSAMWMTPNQKKEIAGNINLYRGLQDEVLQKLTPNVWERAKKRYLPEPEPEKSGDPFAEFGGKRKK